MVFHREVRLLFNKMLIDFSRSFVEFKYIVYSQDVLCHLYHTEATGSLISASENSAAMAFLKDF